MLPERKSSNDLLLEQLQDLLRERQFDLIEGRTLRSIAKMVETHSGEDHERHVELEKRVRDLEIARGELGTGRFQIPPYHQQIIMPQASQAKSRHPSLPPWLSPKSPVVQWAAIGLLGLAHVLSRAGCGVAVPQPPAPAASAVR